MYGWLGKNHNYSDTDCRMTAFLLLDGLLHAESTEDNYDGTYLMFDMEAIDNAFHSAITALEKLVIPLQPFFWLRPRSFRNKVIIRGNASFT